MSGASATRRPRIYELKITLQHIRPPIWRRLRVAENTPLNKLHTIFQIAMGWQSVDYDYHLHSFRVGDRLNERTYGPTDPQFSFDYMLDERRVRLCDVAQAVGSSFRYEYDFGDSWTHMVKVEKILEPTPEIVVPACLTGRRACPPEDVGGIGGYENFVEAIADPNHPEHRELLDWVGGSYDPKKFDIAAVNSALEDL